MRYANPDWDAAVEALARADSVAIACHVNPDGDALGSLLGASIGLRKIGKTTYPTWSDGAVELPFSYAYLAEGETLVRPDDVPQTDVFLALDCGAGDRLGELEKAARSAPVLINVDHHPGNDNFGDLNIVVTGVSSTAELVTRLLQDLGVELDRDIATCLYTGIVTDTGRFQFANAGHDLPYRRHDGSAMELRARGMPLGLMPSSRYEEDEVFLAPGDRVVFYSDGLVEAHNAQREMFSFSLLRDLVANHGVDSASELIDFLLAELARFTGPDWEQEDDIALVTLQRDN